MLFIPNVGQQRRRSRTPEKDQLVIHRLPGCRFDFHISGDIASHPPTMRCRQGRKIVYVVKRCKDTNDRREGCVIMMSELYVSHYALNYIIVQTTALNFALYTD